MAKHLQCKYMKNWFCNTNKAHATDKTSWTASIVVKHMQNKCIKIGFVIRMKHILLTRLLGHLVVKHMQNKYMKNWVRITIFLTRLHGHQVL